jgi:F-type H+-transporting ATPase subunit b
MRPLWTILVTTAVVASRLSVIVAPAVGQESEPAHAESADGHGGHELGHGNASAMLEDASEFKSDLAIYTFVVFLLLLAILSKFAWPPIIKALEERERHIANHIAAAEAKHEDAKRLFAEHEAKLAAAAGEVRALLEEARRDAEVTKRRIEEDGRKAAAEEVARASREIERAKDVALNELAVTSANLAIELGQTVVREKLATSPEHQARIVREALSKLAAATASQN